MDATQRAEAYKRHLGEAAADGQALIDSERFEDTFADSVTKLGALFGSGPGVAANSMRKSVLEELAAAE